MKYEPIEFSKLSEAVAYVEDGGELYQLDAGHAYEVSESSLFNCWRDRLFTEAKPAPWYEKLDGTVENGVLCWVSDKGDKSSHVDLVLRSGSCGGYYVRVSFDGSEMGWDIATPLTRTEIQKFMNNAPEES